MAGVQDQVWRFLPAAEDTEAFGAALARACAGGVRIALQGDLGSGKTTLVRGFLRALGHVGPVRSPTYTLIEPYVLDDLEVFHLDLYRLADPEELEYLGLRDLDRPEAVLLVEWAERGRGLLPSPDLELGLEYRQDGREAALRALSERGRAIRARLTAGGAPKS